MSAKKRIAAIGLILLTAAAAFTEGCGAFERDQTYDRNANEVAVVTDINALEDNAYYVQHGDTYYRLYVGETSFTNHSSSSSSDDRVAWFGDDFDRIPTMYADDAIVYHSTQEFNEHFYVERFEDMGYTIGICNMRRTGAGRYSFSTTSSRLNIDVASDAAVLLQLGDHTAVIDRIGEVDLRSGNISRGGTVVGLEKGKTYATEIYIGTEVYNYNLVADARALVSMDSTELPAFEYTQSQTITFHFPAYFNSGYYYVNGFGFVRYVASDREFDESMNMNIPNIEAVTILETNPQEQEIPETDVRVDTVTIDQTGPYVVTIHYGESEEVLPAPSARLIGEEATYSFNPGEDGTLVVSATLMNGSYRLEITGLAGRTYSFLTESAQEGES